MDPKQTLALDEVLRSELDHNHGLSSEKVDKVVKKLTNNRRIGGTKEDKLKAISKLDTNKESILGRMQTSSNKKLAKDLSFLLAHPLLKQKKNKAEDVARLYFYIAEILKHLRFPGVPGSKSSSTDVMKLAKEIESVPAVSNCTHLRPSGLPEIAIFKV